MKFTFQQLCQYLPYQTEIKDINNDHMSFKLDPIGGTGRIGINEVLSADFYKPVLRPLTDLIKKITIDGKTFMPLEELHNMMHEEKGFKIKELLRAQGDWDRFWITFIDNCDYERQFLFHIGKLDGIGFNSCNIQNLKEPKKDVSQALNVRCNFEMTQKLFEWGFDIYRKIKIGEALNYNDYH